MERIIEIDADDTLLDFHGAAQKVLKSDFGVDFDFKNVQDWAMLSVPADVRKCILSVFSSERTFEKVRWHIGAREALIQLLLNLFSDGVNTDIKVVINTASWSDAYVRYKRLLFEPLKLEMSNLLHKPSCFETLYTVITPSVEKAMLDSYVLVDDSLTNIGASKSQNKFLIAKAHNDNNKYNAWFYDKLELCNSVVRVSCFKEAVPLILKLV